MLGQPPIAQLFSNIRPGLVALVLLAVTFTFTEATLVSPFALTYTPTRIVRGRTENVTLSCKHTGRTRSRLIKVARIRMLKKTESEWKLFAEKRDLMQAKVLDNTARVTGRVSNEIESTFLEVSWPVASDRTIGVYCCEVIGFDHNDKNKVDGTEVVEVTDVFITDLLTMLLDARDNLERDIQASIAAGRADLAPMESSVDALNASLVDMHALLTASNGGTDDMTQELRFLRESFTTFWPGGDFALPRPRLGCPRGDIAWDQVESFFKIHTESSGGAAGGGNQDSVTGAALPSSAITRSSSATGDNFLTLRFCESSDITNDLPWPEGSYCVNRLEGKPCPAGMKEGKVRIDAEDDSNKDEIAGNVAVLNLGEIPYVGFCCMDSAGKFSPLKLPNRSPFLLYSRGGVCQPVEGMVVSDATVVIDTEDVSNGDEAIGFVPDVDVNPGETMTFYLCHYEPN